MIGPLFKQATNDPGAASLLLLHPVYEPRLVRCWTGQHDASKVSSEGFRTYVKPRQLTSLSGQETYIWAVELRCADCNAKRMASSSEYWENWAVEDIPGQLVALFDLG
jgi:hypothetical protein